MALLERIWISWLLLVLCQLGIVVEPSGARRALWPKERDSRIRWAEMGVGDRVVIRVRRRETGRADRGRIVAVGDVVRMGVDCCSGGKSRLG